jgi:hypothetical protein
MALRRAQLLSLIVSTLVAVGVFLVVWPMLRDRAPASVKFHHVEPPPPADITQPIAASPAGENVEEPTEPERWHYYLTPAAAERCFGISRDDRNIFDPWVYFRDKGNLEHVFPCPEHPAKRWVWKSNSIGCREIHELDATPRDIRVLVAGDSHTCGVCNDEESFANQLEAQLAQARGGRTVEVLNAGLGGYSLYNYLGTLLRFRFFAPQVFVVTVFGGNDFMDLLAVDAELTHRGLNSMSEAMHARRKAALEISADAMGQGLNALDTFRDWPHEKAPAMRLALGLCAEMQRVADHNHCKLIVVYLPSPFDLPWKRQQQNAIDARKVLELSDADGEVNRQMGVEFLAGLRAAGTSALDMRPIFEREPEPPYWRLDFHLSLRGHTLVAEALQPLVDAALAGR